MFAWFGESVRVYGMNEQGFIHTVGLAHYVSRIFYNLLVCINIKHLIYQYMKYPEVGYLGHRKKTKRTHPPVNPSRELFSYRCTPVHFPSHHPDLTGPPTPGGSGLTVDPSWGAPGGRMHGGLC